MKQVINNEVVQKISKQVEDTEIINTSILHGTLKEKICGNEKRNAYFSDSRQIMLMNDIVLKE